MYWQKSGKGVPFWIPTKPCLLCLPRAESFTFRQAPSGHYLQEEEGRRGHSECQYLPPPQGPCHGRTGKDHPACRILSLQNHTDGHNHVAALLTHTPTQPELINQGSHAYCKTSGEHFTYKIQTFICFRCSSAVLVYATLRSSVAINHWQSECVMATDETPRTGVVCLIHEQVRPSKNTFFTLWFTWVFDVIMEL